MGWFVLKNRRHVGPYEKAQLVAMHKSGQIEAVDYVIAQLDAERGDLNYKRLGDVIGVVTMPVTKPALPTLKLAKGPESENSRVLGDFSEADLMKSEVSVIFTQRLESVQLLKNKDGTNVGNSAPGANINPGAEGHELLDEEKELPLVLRLKALFPVKRLVLAAVALVVLGAGYEFLGSEGGQVLKTKIRQAQEASHKSKAQARALANRNGADPGRAPANKNEAAPQIRVPKVREDTRRSSDPQPPPLPPQPQAVNEPPPPMNSGNDVTTETSPASNRDPAGHEGPTLNLDNPTPMGEARDLMDDPIRRRHNMMDAPGGGAFPQQPQQDPDGNPIAQPESPPPQD